MAGKIEMHHDLRVYQKAFQAKLSDAESEAAETQVWLEFAVECGYIRPENGALLCQSYDEILTTIVGMINHPETWVLGYQDKTRTPGEKR